MPQRKAGKRRFVDDDVLIDFFLRLGEQDEPVKVEFRFVLALVLMRKRLLKYERTIRDEQGELWQMTLMRDRSQQVVRNPQIGEEQITRIAQQLGSIMEGADELA